MIDEQKFRDAASKCVSDCIENPSNKNSLVVASGIFRFGYQQGILITAESASGQHYIYWPWTEPDDVQLAVDWCWKVYSNHLGHSIDTVYVPAANVKIPLYHSMDEIVANYGKSKTGAATTAKVRPDTVIDFKGN